MTLPITVPHKQNYRKSLRSALRNKKLADSLVDSIHDLQVFAAANGGTIVKPILSSPIIRSTETPYELTSVVKWGAIEPISSMRKVLRAALANKALADKTLNIILELQGYTLTPAQQTTSIVAVADVVTPAVQQTTSIEVVADDNGSLHGATFILEDAAGTVAFWIDVDDTGILVEPVEAVAATRDVKITTITTNMTKADVGTAVYAAIIADSEFEAGSDDLAGNLIIQNVDAGDFSNIDASTSGFTMAVDTAGSLAISSLDGKTFILEDAAGTVAFWIDVDNTGTLKPAEASAATRDVEITTVTAGMTKAQVGTAIYTAIVADSEFEAGSDDLAGNLIIQNADAGYFPTVSASTSGFTVAVADAGSLADTADKMVIQTVVPGNTPFIASNKKALTIALNHVALASDIIDMILELQVQFKDNLLGTCTGTLTNALLTV